MAEMAETSFTSTHVMMDSHVEIIHDNSEYVQETSLSTAQLFDTDELLLRLPSRKLMSSVGSKGSSTTTMRKRKTVRSRSLKFRTIRMPRNANSDDILQKLKDDEVMDTEGQMTEDGKDVIRSLPVSLFGKIQALQRLSEHQQATSRRLRYTTWCSSSITGSWNKFKRRVNNFAFYTALWKSAIKKIKGHFGTSVTSYFLFLKWLFLLNFFSFFLAFCFQVIPQILYRFFEMEPRRYKSNPPFDGTDLLTGKGWLEQTELYYGFYTNESIQIGHSTVPYDMPSAYLLTSALNYLLLLGIIAYSIAKSYKINYVEAGNVDTYYFVTKIFCGWDYGITSKDAAILKHKSVCNEFKEHLTKFKDEIKEKHLYQRCQLYGSRVFSHLLVLGLISASGYFVHYLSNNPPAINTELVKDLTVPVCISAANALLPFIFTGIAYLEYYEHPQTNLYITMVRNMLLKATNISMLCLYWQQKIIGKKKPCWENFISQEIYRLVLVDFFFSLLFTLTFEVCWALLHRCKVIARSPEFNIAANTLDLIYSQCLCWLGLFYSPLMPLIMVVKLFIIFYVKWLSVLKACQTSKKTWNAARTHTIFLGFLLLFFVLTATTVAVSIKFSIPSAEYGPFRNNQNTSAYNVVRNMVTISKESSGKDNYLREVLQFISKPGFITIILVAVCICAYYSRIVLVGHKEMVKLLKYQLAMEGQDKVFLLKLLNQVKSGKIFNNASAKDR